jgi:P4 family phage/plasmid primase-like protien
VNVSPLLQKAQRLAAADISVIAIGPDKRPLGPWAESQHAPASAEALAAQFKSPRATGYAVVTGRVSGGLVCIDIDPDKRGEACEPVDAELVLSWVLEVLGRFLDTSTLVIVRTPSGGYHIYFRCPNPGGNTKLAGLPANNTKGVHYFLETREERGCVAQPGSAHPSGGAYVRVQGDLTDAPMLAQEQYEEAMLALRSLDRMPQKTVDERRLVRDYKRRQGEQSEVIKAFNEANDPADILERNGYQLVKGKYRSPDSTSGNPGVTVFEDAPLVYSHHGDALGDGHAHDAFDVFAILEHDGDKKAAYRAAAQELGLWQEAPPRRKSTPTTPDRQTRTPAGDDQPPDLLGFPRTEYGNAERLRALHGHLVRYCAGLGWLVYDGARWKVDEGATVVRRLALETARELFTQAAKLDGDQRQTWVTWALSCERAASIKNTAELARTLPGMTVEVSDLDADPMLLNVLNGTINLRTGELKTHDPRDLITKLAAVEHDPAAECPRWLEFQRTICADDDELIADKQKFYGYSLTGDTSEQCLFMLYGGGANGKSTELTTISKVSGDYGTVAEFGTFAVRKNEGPRDDIADLAGKRFVSASEGGPRQRLDEAMIKRLTGNDPIKARHLYGSHFTFRPAMKLFLASNYRPRIDGVDDAIWRRVILIPYEVTIPPEKRDKKLGEKLEAELSGILNWLLEGCRMWLKGSKLTEAGAVRQATKEYRADSDELGEFISARCVVDPLYSEGARELYSAYRRYCEDNGDEPVSNTVFGKMLSDRKFDRATERRGTKVVRVRKGICLTESVAERGEA